MNQKQAEDRAFALLKAADTLAARAPVEWQDFVVAMGAYSEVSVVLLLRARGDDVHTAQGRASMAYEIAEMLGECRQRHKEAVAARAAMNRAKPPPQARAQQYAATRTT